MRSRRCSGWIDDVTSNGTPTTAEAAWTPPPTHELSTQDGRVVRYCLYGPADGVPVVSLNATPDTRWERPEGVDGFERAGLRVLVPDRPGYGGSTRQPGRAVADAAADVRALADAQGWERFAVTGFSGGGPHDVLTPLGHSEWLLAAVPGAERRPFGGGHAPDDDDTRRMLAWLGG
ncbi:MAG: alpha/beta fold hydrolase [Actinocatenispora sp.]